MALVSTTLASACSATDQFIKVTSATGAAVGQIWRVDSEFMVQIGAAVGTSIPVARRGLNGSTVQAHTILAPVVNGVANDFPAPQPGSALNPAQWEKQIVSYGASGAITPPTCNTLIFIDKATAGVMTLVGPSAAVDGIEVTIMSTTAAAHTVDYTAGFYADTTASNLATFAAKAGASMTIIAYKGAWGVKALANVTLG
jgi:hypothetical protein